MLPEELIKQLPEWALYLFYGLIAIGMAAKLIQSMKVGAKQEGENHATSRAIRAVSAVQPAAAVMNQETLVQTMAGLKMSVDRLYDRLESQEREREADEKAELRELRRVVKDIRSHE